MITSTYRSWGEAMTLGSRIRQRYRCEVQHISPDSAESAGAVGAPPRHRKAAPEVSAAKMGAPPVRVALVVGGYTSALTISVPSRLASAQQSQQMRKIEAVGWLSRASSTTMRA